MPLNTSSQLECQPGGTETPSRLQTFPNAFLRGNRLSLNFACPCQNGNNIEKRRMASVWQCIPVGKQTLRQEEKILRGPSQASNKQSCGRILTLSLNPSG